MSLLRHLPLLLLATASPALAQNPALQTMPRPTPDADALADAMRRLGSNPRDLASLIEAAELSLKLGDVTAAAALLKRADEIDPMNGRVKAGMARILVSQERPGEALRYFDQAAGYGLDPRSFAGDRGLAYDLIGEPERAQRDYRLALKAGVQDEVQRRYALSLGISGKREAALEEIDALLRRNDRGAWRARAFILAMTGDVPGAEKIATTMMPTGMAAALQPFFGKLAVLPTGDRAFAVHFGEVRATPQRLADRRLAPALPALTPEAASPTKLAAVTPAPTPVRERRSERDRRRSRTERVQVASTAVVAAVPAKPDLPPPPAYEGVSFAPPREVAQAVPRTAPTPAPTPTPTPAPTAREAVRTAPERQVAAVVPVPARSAPAATVPPATARPQPTALGEGAALAQAAPRPAPVTAPTRPPASEDTILARIMAGISIPAAELAPAPSPPSPGPGASVATPASIASAETARRAALAAREKPVTPREKVAEAKPAVSRKDVAEAKPVIDPQVAARKAAAEKKAADAKKLADAKRLAEKKKAAEEARLAKADPPRIWVQVAGGARESDLPKAWSSAKGKAAALQGKAAYTTPLRATNRVVTGPFKTDAEARAFVNTLAKQGISAFPFTSEKGQKMKKLGEK